MYRYVANSPLVGQIAFAQGGTTRMTTVKQYDYLNLLSSIASAPSISFAYWRICCIGRNEMKNNKYYVLTPL
ncbi:MAG TPA: hypothetical protein VGO67_20780 [Verrucomicrobiae bacterium]